jgi:hypothetical protein
MRSSSQKLLRNKRSSWCPHIILETSRAEPGSWAQYPVVVAPALRFGGCVLDDYRVMSGNRVAGLKHPASDNYVKGYCYTIIALHFNFWQGDEMFIITWTVVGYWRPALWMAHVCR